MSLDKIKIGIVFLGIIIGGVLGVAGSYRYYTPIVLDYTSDIADKSSEISILVTDAEAQTIRYDELESDYNSLTGQHETLENNYESLTDDYESLESEYSVLMNNYASISEQYYELTDDYQDLESDYNTLDSEKRTLQTQYDTNLDRLGSLSEDVLNFKEITDSLRNLEISFERVLCEAEVDKIATIVTDITDPDSTWTSYYAIYNYVNENVDYAKDAEIVCIDSYSYVTIQGSRYLTGFSTGTSRNQIQTPEYTLEYEQGDCDDHAILIYAMIKYYLFNIYGTNYRDYIMSIEFSDGGAHLAVLIPVVNGNMCILDSAGNYYTNRRGYIASKTVSNEFYTYQDHWSENGEITRIQLYRVDMPDGDFTLEADGTIEDIISYLESEFD